MSILIEIPQNRRPRCGETGLRYSGYEWQTARSMTLRAFHCNSPIQDFVSILELYLIAEEKDEPRVAAEARGNDGGEHDSRGPASEVCWNIAKLPADKRSPSGLVSAILPRALTALD
jgi:hypothetical protein